MRTATLLAAASLAAAAAVTSLTGCANPPAAAEPDPVSEAQYPKIAALEGLGDFVVSGKPMSTRDDSGALTAVVPVRSKENKDVPIQYRFFFFDKSNMPLEPEMDWRYMVLPARSQVFLRGASLSSRAVDWRAEMRPAR